MKKPKFCHNSEFKINYPMCALIIYYKYTPFPVNQTKGESQIYAIFLVPPCVLLATLVFITSFKFEKTKYPVKYHKLKIFLFFSITLQ